MKTRSNLTKTLAILICVLCLATLVTAQKKRTTPRRTTAKPTPTAAATTPVNNLEIQDAAKKASVQLKNVTRFIYLLGSIAQGIEDVDKEIKDGKASAAATDINTKNKQNVVSGIRNLRAGLTTLEIDFRAKPSLRTYVPQIGGITEIAANAEDRAVAGQFKDAGRVLLEIVEKLSDALAAMP